MARVVCGVGCWWSDYLLLFVVVVVGGGGGLPVRLLGRRRGGQGDGRAHRGVHRLQLGVVPLIVRGVVVGAGGQHRPAHHLVGARQPVVLGVARGRGGGRGGGAR